MKINMGKKDRIIRAVLAIVFLAFYFAGKLSPTVGIIMIIVAAIFLVTSLFGTCPLYSLFGISSCSVKENE